MATIKQKVLSLISRWLPVRVPAGNSSSVDDSVRFSDSQIEKALLSVEKEKLVEIQSDGIVQSVPCKHEARYRFDSDAPSFSFDGYVRSSDDSFDDPTFARLIDDHGKTIYFTKAVFLKYFKKV